MSITKSLSTKQAERWLQKLRDTDMNSFRELGKVLKNFDRSQNQYECFVKMNIALTQPSLKNLTQEFNYYLEQGNKMLIDNGLNQRVQDFLTKVKRVRPQTFNDIIGLITKWDQQRKEQQKNGRESNMETQNIDIKNQMIEYFKNDQELIPQVERAFASPQQLVKRNLDIPHLKQKTVVQVQVEEDIQKQLPSKKIKKDITPRRQKIQKEPEVKQKIVSNKYKRILPFLNSTEETIFLKQLESKNQRNFKKLVRILFLYKQTIITSSQFLSFVSCLLEPGSQFEAFKDIIESREAARKKLSRFKPLCDSNFDHQQRITHSYVIMPNYYPNNCPTKTKDLEKLLNSKYVSVPRGSQETFNIKPKNSFELVLTKAEDEHYETDIILVKLSKTINLLESVRLKLLKDPDFDLMKSPQFKLAISLRSIQSTYKLASLDQQGQLQLYLRHSPEQTIQTILYRLKNVYQQLQNIKNIHGQKVWCDAASKNYHKALEARMNQFKRIEKAKLKSTVFIQQLKTCTKNLIDRSKGKTIQTPFEEDKQFFSVLNTFEIISRKQKCTNRNITSPIQYDILKFINPTILPSQILSFEDQQALRIVYALIIFYLQYGGTLNEQQKTRNRQFLQVTLSRFLNFNKFQRRGLDTRFNEEKFYSDLNGMNFQTIPVLDLRTQIFAQDQIVDSTLFKKNENPPKNKFINDNITPFSYLPTEGQGYNVLFASQNFYVFIRFLYTFYERIIKMRQTVKTEEKSTMFELLYYLFIKSKQSTKYEDYLTQILGNSAYLFTTLYKLSESLVKSLSAASICAITSHSFNKHYGLHKEEIYLLLMQRYISSLASSNPRIIRLNFDTTTGLLYIHNIQMNNSTDQQLHKQSGRRHSQFTSNIDIYTVVPPQQWQNQLFKKDLNRNYREIANQMECKNGQEFCFLSNCYRLMNLPNQQDLLINKKRKQNKIEQVKKQLIKNTQLMQFLGL